MTIDFNIMLLKIDPVRKAEWVAALRSGDYERGKGYLCKDNSFCCLGVITDLAVQAGVLEPPHVNDVDDDVYCIYDAGDGGVGTSTALPVQVQKWLGMTSVPLEPKNDPRVIVTPAIQARLMELDSGFFKHSRLSLSILNDAGMTFDEIADIIEEQL